MTVAFDGNPAMCWWCRLEADHAPEPSLIEAERTRGLPATRSLQRWAPASSVSLTIAHTGVALQHGKKSSKQLKSIDRWACLVRYVSE
jgi:hypothetical protein